MDSTGLPKDRNSKLFEIRFKNFIIRPSFFLFLFSIEKSNKRTRFIFLKEIKQLWQ